MADIKFQEQTELNALYNEQKRKISALNKENILLDDQLAQIKSHFRLEYTDNADAVINKYETLKSDYYTADNVLRNELNLSYNAAKALTLTEKANKCVSSFRSEINLKDSIIDDLQKLKDNLSFKLTEMQQCLSKAVKAIGELVWGTDHYKIDLPQRTQNFIAAISNYAVKKLRDQNADELADDIEEFVNVDKEILELVKNPKVEYLKYRER